MTEVVTASRKSEALVLKQQREVRLVLLLFGIGPGLVVALLGGWATAAGLIWAALALRLFFSPAATVDQSGATITRPFGKDVIPVDSIVAINHDPGQKGNLFRGRYHQDATVLLHRRNGKPVSLHPLALDSGDLRDFAKSANDVLGIDLSRVSKSSLKGDRSQLEDIAMVNAEFARHRMTMPLMLATFSPMFGYFEVFNDGPTRWLLVGACVAGTIAGVIWCTKTVRSYRQQTRWTD